MGEHWTAIQTGRGLYFYTCHCPRELRPPSYCEWRNSIDAEPIDGADGGSDAGASNMSKSKNSPKSMAAAGAAGSTAFGKGTKEFMPKTGPDMLPTRE